MTWFLAAITVWAAVAVCAAVVIGRSIRLRDEAAAGPSRSAVPDFVPAEWGLPTAGSR